MHRSPYFGQSVEFLQHREYVTGDDLRHVDWKVWARQDRLYVKQFEEETNLRCTLLMDISNSMAYGNGPMNKYEYACTAAACLGYLVVRQQDSAGLVSYGFDVKQALPPRSSQTQVDAITKTLDLSRPEGTEKTDVLRALQRIAEITTRRRMVVLFSDLLTDREPIFQGLESAE